MRRDFIGKAAGAMAGVVFCGCGLLHPPGARASPRAPPRSRGQRPPRQVIKSSLPGDNQRLKFVDEMRVHVNARYWHRADIQIASQASQNVLFWGSADAKF